MKFILASVLAAIACAALEYKPEPAGDDLAALEKAAYDALTPAAYKGLYDQYKAAKAAGTDPSGSQNKAKEEFDKSLATKTAAW